MVDYKVVAGMEANGSCGVKILVGGFDDELEFIRTLPSDNENRYLIQERVDEIRNMLLCIREQISMDGKKRKKDIVERLTSLFESPIYVEEIPNEYHQKGSPYGVNCPWLIVTTKIGRIKIGWRKKVIEIDWTDSQNHLCGQMLFPNEVVTKSAQYDKLRYVHAWGYEKAKEYLSIIIGDLEQEGKSE